MRIKGFSMVGHFTTKYNGSNDPVHVIYMCENKALIALCRYRSKRAKDPWYLLYGYDIVLGDALAIYPHIRSYEQARERVQELFGDQHPEVLINNHLAEYVSRAYNSQFYGQDERTHRYGGVTKNRWRNDEGDTLLPMTQDLPPNEAVIQFTERMDTFKRELVATIEANKHRPRPNGWGHWAPWDCDCDTLTTLPDRPNENAEY